MTSATIVDERWAPIPRRSGSTVGRGPPAPLYIVCSPIRGVGKTLMARLLHDYHAADGRHVAAFDLADESPQLADFTSTTGTATTMVANIGDLRGQVDLFDTLIEAAEALKIVDVGYRQFADFFAIAAKIGLFDEVRRRAIEPVILFMIDPNPKAQGAYRMLRQRFPSVSLLPVRNQMVARGVPRAGAFPHASPLAVSLDIPLLGPALRALIDDRGFSFVPACANLPTLGLNARRDDELRKWAKRIGLQFREIELGLICEQILSSLR